MLVRDATGKINIISRSSYNSESAYNEQIYKFYYTYTMMYKTVFKYDLFEYSNNNKQHTLNNHLDKDKDKENDSDDEY
jgi:hypothetical protein